MEYKDYYKILGVPKTASEQEIKKAYRQLARKHHPDANPNDKTAEDRIKEINEAYEVLSDADKRSKYDQFGAQWQQFARGGGNPQDFWRQWQGGQGQPGGTYTQTVSPEEFEQMFGGGRLGGFSDFFEVLFGRGARPGGRQTGGFDPFAGVGGQMARKGQDAEQPIDVTLEEAHRGATRVLQIDGERLEVKIPRGVKTGSRVRVAGKGGPGLSGGAAGDLYLRVHVPPHETFTREGDDLRLRLGVDLYTLVLGGETQVPTLERPVVLNIPAGTPNGKIFRLRGLGMPHLRQPDQRGDLLVTIEAQLPQNLTSQEQELFRQLRSLRATA